MLRKVHTIEEPAQIEVDNQAGGVQWIKIRRNTQPHELDDPELGSEFISDEVAFRYRDRVLTVEEIQAAEDDWWTYGESWTEESEIPPTLEQQVQDLQIALLALMGL